MARNEALIKPALLVWARESLALTLDEAAKRSKFAVAKIDAWEKGEGRPTITQLKKLASVYKRPLGVFFLPAPPKDFKPMRDFRRLPTEFLREFSPALLLEMRRAQFRQSVARDFADVSATLPRAITGEDPETVAARLRSALRISLETQRGWKDEQQALNGWKGAIEGLGVLIFQFGKVEVAEARGFSSFDDRAPVVAVNGKDATRGRIFSLFHELTHLALGGEGVCDWIGGGAEGVALETFCNRVAAALLVPRDALMSLDVVLTHAGTWTDAELGRIANTFHVSLEAALLRLVSVGKAPQAFYQKKRVELLEEYRAWSLKKRFGRGTPVTKTVSRLGTLFPRIVLEAHHGDLISAGDVSDYLDLKLKHLGAIERQVFEPPAARG